MNRIFETIFTFVFAISTVFAQTAPPARQLGVSVQMATTESAQPAPEADAASAWVVTIDRFGGLFVNANHTDLTELGNWMKSHPRDRDAKLYIKADVGVGFAVVRKVLNAGREVGFQAPVLLTTQPSGSSQSGVVHPMGLDVQMEPAAASDLPTVEVFKTNQTSPMIKINNQKVPANTFAPTLSSVLQAQKQKAVVLNVDDRLLFAQVIHVIDLCHAAGATVALKAQE